MTKREEAMQWFNSLDRSTQRNLHQSVGGNIQDMYLNRNNVDIYILWSDAGLDAYSWFMSLEEADKIMAAIALDISKLELTYIHLESMSIYIHELSWYILTLTNEDRSRLLSIYPELQFGKISIIKEVYRKEIRKKDNRSEWMLNQTFRNKKAIEAVNWFYKHTKEMQDLILTREGEPFVRDTGYYLEHGQRISTEKLAEIYSAQIKDYTLFNDENNS